MIRVESEQALLAYFAANVPGYLPGTLRPSGTSFETSIPGTYASTWSYMLTVGEGSFATKECYVQNDDLGIGLLLPVKAETDDGIMRVVSSFSGPNEYYPWVFSIFGHMARDGATVNAPKVRPDGTPFQEGDSDANSYYKYTFSEVLAYEIGFQNIVACWARFNEGDCADVFVDVPGPMAAYAAQQAGETDPNVLGYLNSLEWYQFAQFGEDITLFDSNPKGTHYPPTQSPAMSWIPAGARIRVDIYKKVIDDHQFRLLEGETELTHPLKRGPFLDLDILCQRKR